MEKPSSSDPNFKAFLNKLKEQNGNESFTQKDPLSSSNNTKGELDGVKDSFKQGLQGVNDNLVKVQDRLDTANSSLSKIAAAIQGNALDKAVKLDKAKKDKEDEEEVDNFDPSLKGRLKSFMTDGESDKPGYGIFQKPPAEVVKKEREDKVSSPREVNPEADNINTSAEIQADAAKKDLELSKEMLDTTKEELTLLKEIKDALSPKTPAELGDNNTQGIGAAGAALAPEASSSPGVNIDLPAPSLPDKKDGKPGKPGKETGKASKAVAKGIGKSLLKKIPVIGAVAGLAYGASRAMSGDFAGAGMEVASGLAGTVPGVGTAASVGIDAALAAKDAGVFDKEQAPATAPAPAAAPKPAPVQATAPVTTASASLGGAIAATAAPAATKPSKGTSSFKGSENLEKLQIAEGELQGLYSDLRDEKGKLLEKFVNDRKRFPGGVPSDPSDPDYPKELKAIDDKYQKQIDAKKKEVSELGKAPGISEAKKAAKDFDDDIDKGFSDEAPAKSVSKVTGGNVKSSEFSITSTQSLETVTGGETTTKRVLTDDAKKAETELTGMSGKHTAERKQAVDKLKSEGKITGRFATDEDYQKIPELKDLKAKQDAERSVIAKRIDKGTSTDVSKVSIDNATMRDEMSASRSDSSTVVSNNISSNNTTKFVPMKSSPRAENTGSALDRYTSRITTY
jgi:hypothetical protein